MRLPRFQLRTMMTAIVFFALILCLFVQSIRLRQALLREQLLVAKANREIAIAQMRMAEAETFLKNPEPARQQPSNPIPPRP